MPINISVPEEESELQPRISVIGVGGAGGNAVNNMIESALEGVEFIVANTDAQAVGLSKADTKIQLGVQTTQGLGAGSMPGVGTAAAEESLEEILEHVGDSHMLFVTAGMGGGTGTGAAPVIAQAAKERGILTVGVVTKPFHFEGARRMRVAMAGIEELQKHVDTLLIIPNQNLFSIANEQTTFHEAFAMADDVLHSGVRGITDLMVMPGLINLDFADVRTVMGEMGQAMMGTGEAEGEKRAIEAAEAAISNPLLDKVSMKGARGVLINITGSMDMKLFEIDEAANRIRAEVDPDANIIIGSTFNQELEGKVRVSVVATGIDMERDEENDPSVKPQMVAPQDLAPKPWRQEVEPVAQQQNQSVGASPQRHEPRERVQGGFRGHQSQRVATAQAGDARTADKAAPAPALTGSLAQDPIEQNVQANPVGDVQARIRRLLTEGDGDTLNPATPEQPIKAPSEAQQGRTTPRPNAGPVAAKRNPFRPNGGRNSIGAAVGGMLKNLSTPSDSETQKEAATRREAERKALSRTAKPAKHSASGDLFEDEIDPEFEIPAFFHKNKAS